MYVCICLCLFLCVCVCVCLFVCLLACLLVCLLACLLVCLLACLFDGLFVCSFVCLFVRLFVCLFVCACVCVCVGRVLRGLRFDLTSGASPLISEVARATFRAASNWHDTPSSELLKRHESVLGPFEEGFGFRAYIYGLSLGFKVCCKDGPISDEQLEQLSVRPDPFCGV